MRGYKVKIVLNGSKPPIWRTCILPEGLALRELPDVFERVMGWRDSEHDPVRLARFVFGDADTTFESDGTDDEGKPVRWDAGPIEEKMPGITVQRLHRRTVKKDEPLAGPLLAATAAGSGEFRYTFLPGKAEWEHRVKITKVIEDGPDYPELLAHSGDCPPAEYEGGIFRYQSLSPKERKKARAGHFPYNPKMIAERLESYYLLSDGKETVKGKNGKGVPEIAKIKINESAMEEAFRAWMKERNADAPEHFSIRDGLAKVAEASLDDLLAKWDVKPEKYAGLDSDGKAGLIAQYAGAPGMLERYLRAVSDQEWSSIKHAVEWETWRYYLLPGEDDFYRLWQEGYIFPTEIQEIETPDEIRELFPRLDQDKFFQKRRQETSWVRDCSEMAAELYGIASVAQVTKLCNLKSGVQLTEAQVRGILEDITPPQRNYIIDAQRDEIVKRGLHHEDLLREHMATDLDYMMPPLDTIGAQHGIFVFPTDKKSVDVVQKHLERWCGQEKTMQYLQLLLTMLADSIPKIERPAAFAGFFKLRYPELMDGKSMEDMARFALEVEKMGRYIRRKALRGWTQDEVERGRAKKLSD